MSHRAEVSTKSVLGRRSAVVNLAAQGGALLALSVASLLVARLAGAAVVGEYALLRVLPWLTGVVVSAGLPVASAYFLSGRHETNPRLRPTLAALAVAGAVLGASGWLIATPLLHRLFFSAVPIWLLALTAATVVTQLLTVWAKACCQGAADMRGANLVIVGEELLFLPAYGFALLFGFSGITAVIGGLLLGGVLATMLALGRLAQTGFGQEWGRPSVRLGVDVVAFGTRGQLGNLLWLVNLRLDFLVLDAIAGSVVLGIYAIASKFAELMRLPATALNYVLYPRFARAEPVRASLDLRRLLPRATALTIAATPVLAVAAVVALPILYGNAFKPAVLPACLLLIGLTVEGAAAVSSAYLCGIGRPGANSWGMGVGVVVTVTLDLLLIPSLGAVGAAIASSIAYIVTTALLASLSHRFAQHTLREGAPGAFKKEARV